MSKNKCDKSNYLLLKKAKSTKILQKNIFTIIIFYFKNKEKFKVKKKQRKKQKKILNIKKKILFLI